MPVVIDVDDTLIRDMNIDEVRELDDVYTMNYYGVETIKVPIQNHIDLLKSYKARGYEVTVWSANGWEWASEVVTKLKLENYVDHIATKPQKYVDDKPAEQWMQQVFIHE